jgi:hypothetical protein
MMMLTAGAVSSLAQLRLGSRDVVGCEAAEAEHEGAAGEGDVRWGGGRRVNGVVGVVGVMGAHRANGASGADAVAHACGGLDLGCG